MKPIVIDEEIKEVASYLAMVFSKSIRNTVDSYEDLYQDLLVVYLEKGRKGIFKKLKNKPKQELKNFCFRVFKNYLLDKYKREVIRRKIEEQLLRDSKQEAMLEITNRN